MCARSRSFFSRYSLRRVIDLDLVLDVHLRAPGSRSSKRGTPSTSATMLAAK